MVEDFGLWQRQKWKQSNCGFGIYKGVFGMRERKKPAQSWIERSLHEIENADRLLAERIEKVKKIRQEKNEKGK